MATAGAWFWFLVVVGLLGLVTADGWLLVKMGQWFASSTVISRELQPWRIWVYAGLLLTLGNTVVLLALTVPRLRVWAAYTRWVAYIRRL